MDLHQLFIYNLKKWRKKMGLSQKALAEQCNAAHSYIRQIESGRGYPSFMFIGKLAGALNIEPYHLFYDETAGMPCPSQQPARKEAAKAEFLKKMACELDRILDELESGYQQTGSDK